MEKGLFGKLLVENVLDELAPGQPLELLPLLVLTKETVTAPTNHV